MSLRLSITISSRGLRSVKAKGGGEKDNPLNFWGKEGGEKMHALLSP